MGWRRCLYAAGNGRLVLRWPPSGHSAWAVRHMLLNAPTVATISPPPSKPKGSVALMCVSVAADSS